MNYSSEIIIGIPLSDFIKKIHNPENFKHWQKNFIAYEYLSGVPGEIGSKMKLTYTMGKKQMELIETVIDKKIPHEFHAMYDAKGMQNIQKNYFSETPNGQTKWVSYNEFTASSFKLRMMLLLMPKAFKKQSKQFMQDFKNFAEKSTNYNR